MKYASQQGSAASLGLTGGFLSATLSTKSRGFACQAESGKTLWALGRISPPPEVLVPAVLQCYDATRIRVSKSAILESGFLLRYPVLSLLSPEIIVLLLLL